MALRPGRWQDGVWLEEPRKLAHSELDPRTLHGRKPNRFTFVIADRLGGPRETPLFWDVVSNLDAQIFFPGERIPVIIRLCDRGLEEARRMPFVDRLNYRALRLVLFERNWLHPASPILWQHKRRLDECFTHDEGGLG